MLVAAIHINNLDILYFVGALLLLFGAWPTGFFRQISFFAGSTILLGGLAVSSINLGSSAMPPPRPVDPVVINQSFNDKVLELFDGTTAEAQVLAALADQYAVFLTVDGNRTRDGKPYRYINSSRDLGLNWEEFQKVRAASDSPWGNRFSSLAVYLGSQLKDREIITPEGKTKRIEGSGDPTREAAIKFYRELSTALLQVKR